MISRTNKPNTLYEKGPRMPEDIKTNQCADPTQKFTVELPCQMIERIERYAKKNGATVDGVLIEALDRFLSRPE